jgi:hypothetical protein
MKTFLKRNFLQLTIGLALFIIATESCWHKSCEQVCIER